MDATFSGLGGTIMELKGCQASGSHQELISYISAVEREQSVSGVKQALVRTAKGDGYSMIPVSGL